jgi:acyl-CoA thioesterase-1
MNESAGPRVQVRFMRRLIFLLCFALAASASGISRDGSKMPIVLVLGDSLSAGYGLKRDDAYPALLPKKAVAAGRDLKVLNAGLSGDTTAGGLRRLPELLHHHFDVLLVELGTNDAFRGVPVPQIEANLQAIIDLTKRRYPRVRVVIAGMQLPQSSDDEYLRAFGEMFERVARRNDAELVPFLLAGVAGNPALNLPDMIHPNEAGQRILAENVWQVLRRALR